MYYGSRIGIFELNKSFPVPKPFSVHRRKSSLEVSAAGCCSITAAINLARIDANVGSNDDQSVVSVVVGVVAVVVAVADISVVAAGD